jgi:hypothetical protein
MEQQRGEKIRVVLRQIQILDDKEPFFKDGGEFQFKARVYTTNFGGVSTEKRFPETGYYTISDLPGHNILPMKDMVLFEGAVEDHLAVEFTGVELDTFSPNDELNPYRRVFSGAPASWLGQYGPGDESVEPEDMGDWRVWYRIERV